MTVLPPTMPCQLARHPATWPAGMVHDAIIEVLGGLGVLGLADDLVELDAERVGDQAHRLAEHRGALRGHRLQVGIVDRLAEAHRTLGVGGVVEGGVGRLGDGDLVDPVADVAATIASSSAKPGLMPVPNSVDPPRSHASAIRSRSAPRLRPVMNDAVATTFTPASRMRTSSSTSGHIGL